MNTMSKMILCAAAAVGLMLGSVAGCSDHVEYRYINQTQSGLGDDSGNGCGNMDATSDAASEAAVDTGADTATDSAADVGTDAVADASSCSPGWVQTSGHNTYTFGGSPHATTKFSAANTAGNFIAVVGLSEESNGSIHTPTDTAGNTYHLAFDQPQPPTADGHLFMFYAYNIKMAAAGNVITVAGNGGINDINDLQSAEFSGVLASSDPLDVAKGNESTTGQPSTVNLTTTTACDLLLGWITSENAQTVAGPTTPNNIESNLNMFEWGVDSSSGAVVVSSGPTDTSFNAIAAGFKQ